MRSRRPAVPDALARTHLSATTATHGALRVPFHGQRQRVEAATEELTTRGLWALVFVVGTPPSVRASYDSHAAFDQEIFDVLDRHGVRYVCVEPPAPHERAHARSAQWRHGRR